MEMIQTIKRRLVLGTIITRLVAINKDSLLWVVAMAILYPMGCKNCENSMRSEMVSPNGQLIARICERNCGATTDFSSVVNLQNALDKYDSNEGVLFVAKGRYEISATWTDSKNIVITCRGCSRPNVFREVSIMGDIDVSYAFTSK